MSDENVIFLRLEGEKGESTGKSYDGEFKVLKYLTNRQRGEVSRYLEMLANGIERDTNTLLLYQAVAHLKTHVQEAPKWWTDAEHGLNLQDSSPVFKLYGLLLDAQKPPKDEAKAEAPS